MELYNFFYFVEQVHYQLKINLENIEGCSKPQEAAKVDDCRIEQMLKLCVCALKFEHGYCEILERKCFNDFIFFQAHFTPTVTSFIACLSK